MFPEQNLNGYSKAQVASAFSNKRLELTLLPTEKCNFRCVYCYETFEQGAMKSHVVDGVCALISERCKDLEYLALSWFGGEPFAAKRVMRKIVDHAYRECQRNDVLLEGGFTTNGYLVDIGDIEHFSNLNHRHYQITLDGDEEQHNLVRRLANGAGTFDRIWKLLTDAAATDLEFHFTLRLHLSPGNLASVEKLLFKLNSEFASDNRFSIHFHKVTDLGGPNSKTFPTFSTDSYVRHLAQLREKVGLEIPSQSEVELVANKGICYAAKANHLLVRSNGKLGKCTVAFDDPRNDIGHINPDGSISVIQERWRLWLDGFKNMDERILGCPLTGLAEDPLSKERTIAMTVAEA